MGPIEQIQIINIVTIVSTSIIASLFFAFNPARQQKSQSIAINYFMLFFICMALSYVILSLRPFSNFNFSLIATNSLEVIGITSLYNGFLWRAGIKKHIYQDKLTLSFIALYLFVQLVLLSKIFDNFNLRHLFTVIVYLSFFLWCSKILSANRKRLTFGEKISKSGLLISSIILIFIGFIPLIAQEEVMFLSLLMMAQTMLVVIIMGSLLSLLLSDMADLHFENSITDSMTGLFNRRYFIDQAAIKIKESERYQQFTIIVMCDIDNFKEINDSYGHNIGDKVICAIATLLQSIARESDLIARFGGEEFIMLLPKTDQNGGIELSERLRLAIEKLNIASPKGLIQITASFGVTEFTGPANLEDKIKEADDALYLAKNSGRNQVKAHDIKSSLLKAVDGS